MVLQKTDPPIRVPFPLNNPISPLPSAPPPPGTPPGSPPAPGKKRIGPAQPRVGSLPKIEVSGTLSVLRCSGKNTKNKTLQNNYRNNYYRNNYNQLQTATERITANNYKKTKKQKNTWLNTYPMKTKRLTWPIIFCFRAHGLGLLPSRLRVDPNDFLGFGSPFRLPFPCLHILDSKRTLQKGHTQGTKETCNT